MNLIQEDGSILPFAPANYFHLFGLEEGFLVNKEKLEAAYLHVQKQIHPDQFTQSSSRQQLLSLQWGAYVNDAYLALKNNVKRAVYLLSLKGEIDVLQNHKLPSNIMTEQFMWREQLEECENLSTLALTVKEKQNQAALAFEKAIVENEMNHAKDALLIMQFTEKFLKELKRKR